MRRFYGLSLTDVLDCSLSPRESLNIIARLPWDSRTISAERFGDDWEGWTMEMQFSALSYEMNTFLLHTFKQVNSEKPVKPVPEPLDLPGRKKKPQKNAFADMLAKAKQHDQKKNQK